VTATAVGELKAKRQRGLVAAMKRVRLGWTQGAYCRDKFGTAVLPGSRQVYRVDLAYALVDCATAHGLPEDDLRRLVTEQLPAAYRNDPHFGIERWNDVQYRTRTEVVLLLERTLNGL
jgi:hypothetical protein